MNDDDFTQIDLTDVPGWDEFSAAGGPAPRASAATLDRTRAALRAAAAAEAEPADVPVQLSRWQSKRMKAGVGLLAVAAVAAAVIAVPTIGISGSQPASTATASEFLRTVAAQVPAQADSKYWRFEYIVWADATDSSGAVTSDPTTFTRWYERGKAAHFRSVESPQAQAERTAMGAPQQDAMQSEPARPLFDFVAPSTLTWDELAQLPNDPAQLLALMKNDQSKATRSATGNLAIFEGITSLLATAPVDSQTRAALFEVASGLPDVTLTGTGTDTQGRTGTWLELTDDHFAVTKRILVADDGTLLESVTAPLAAGASPLYRTTYLSARGTETLS